jgi:excisionase family DNA binding protein
MSENNAGNSSSDREVIGTTDAARYLGVHPQTIRAMIRDGRLAAARVGDRIRVRRADLDALFATTTGAGRRD